MKAANAWLIARWRLSSGASWKESDTEEWSGGEWLVRGTFSDGEANFTERVFTYDNSESRGIRHGGGGGQTERVAAWGGGGEPEMSL